MYYFRCWMLVLICMVTMAGPAGAQVEDDADAIADCYLAAMQRKDYGFLSKNELRRRRDQIAAFTTKHLAQSLDKSSLDSTIINLHNYEWGQLYLWCRPRAIKPRQ